MLSSRLLLFRLDVGLYTLLFGTMLDIPAGVTHEEGQTGVTFFSPPSSCGVVALIVVPRRIHPFQTSKIEQFARPWQTDTPDYTYTVPRTLAVYSRTTDGVLGATNTPIKRGRSLLVVG